MVDGPHMSCMSMLQYLNDNRLCDITSLFCYQAEIDALKRENEKLREKICESVK